MGIGNGAAGMLVRQRPARPSPPVPKETVDIRRRRERSGRRDHPHYSTPAAGWELERGRQDGEVIRLLQ